MKALVTGSCGLVGYAAVQRLLKEGYEVVGVDNDRRAFFFGQEGSTSGTLEELTKNPRYVHHSVDIRDTPGIEEVFGSGVDLVVHCAAQPSHDYATTHIDEDFGVNALGTLNMLQTWKSKCPSAPFIHVSTSKVYGDNPNRLNLIEKETRWDLREDDPLWNGIPESFSVDQCLHSFFGVNKLTGDLLAQEFGRHFGMPVGIFRPGCITGGNHKGVELHGFLQYLMRCVYEGRPYTIYGYKGKQVRCNVHAEDLVSAFLLYASNPRPGAVYNVGGRGLDCSMREAIEACERLCGRQAVTSYREQPRTGDHIWWISDARLLGRELGWEPTLSLADTLEDVYGRLRGRAGA